MQPYIEKVIVEYIYYPGQRMQIVAYNDCAQKVRNKTKWLAFIDLDEFIVPIKEKTIKHIIEGLPSYANQLVVGWALYGSSGHEKRPEGLVIENYKYRQSNNTNFLFKSIVRADKLLLAENPLSIVLANTTVSSKGEFFEDQGINNRICIDEIRINHYHCKSWEEYSKKAPRGDALNVAKFGENRYSRDFFDLHDQNDVLDFIMEKYINKLKNII